MKNIIIILILFFISTSISSSQIIQDYPFKTYLDSANNLFVCGYTLNGNSKDIYTAKYLPGENNPIWYDIYFSPFGDDRGLDLAVDRNGNVYVTGFIFNTNTNSNDIITLMYNSAGIFQWDTIFYNNGDDKGMGIDISINPQGFADEIFVTGYVTNHISSKDYITFRYNEIGIPQWQHIYNSYPGDDVATDIFVDVAHAYVVGYSYQGIKYGDDIMILTYDKGIGFLEDAIIYYKPWTNEKPTSFIAINKSDVPIQKSRSAVTCTTDEFGYFNNSPKFLTIFFDEDYQHTLQVRWYKLFSNINSRINIPTSIAADSAENVYVTGYVKNGHNGFQSNGLDFATIKYEKVHGNQQWIEFYNHDNYSTTGVNDKASSIKVNNAEVLYVAGQSDGSPNGFSIVQYKQQGGTPLKIWNKTFIPRFIADVPGSSQYNKWATIELANDGTALLIVMMWNENNAFWAARRYDQDGNELYTIENSNNSDKANKLKDEVIINNYPNPFNPSTTINYTLPFSGNVTMKVYNMLGEEIKTLVNEYQSNGNYKVNFDATNLSSGIYFYHIVIHSDRMNINGNITVTKRLMLIK